MQTPLEAVRVMLGQAAHVVILTHINPDPDAIASAVALRYLLRECFAVTAVIGYRGIIGRAENRALVRYLRRPLRRMAPTELEHADAVLLVDTQPGMANCSAGPRAAGLHPIYQTTARRSFFKMTCTLQAAKEKTDARTNLQS